MSILIAVMSDKTLWDEQHFREAETEWVERFEKLEAEIDALRAAAWAVIDSINDENEIDPDAIARLSETLARRFSNTLSNSP